jgi:ribonuclease BN (tRNA processing enzyme)
MRGRTDGTRGPRLTLTPIGVGTAYARPGEVQSCYLVRAAGGGAVALDMGAGALNRLQSAIAPEDLTAIVISHLHPDHCTDLMALRVYMVWGPAAGRTIRVLGPPGLRDRLAAFSGSEGWDSAFRFEELAGVGGERELSGGLALRYAEVPHLPPTYALRLEHAGASVCYGADGGPGPELPALARACDLLVCECSFGAAPVPEGVAHMNARTAGEAARRARAGRLLLTHCFPEHDRRAALEEARRAFGGPVEWARQGAAVTV